MPKMTFIEPNGTRHEVDAPLGLSVLEVAHKHGLDLEGACEGSLACSTCHVIVEPEWFDVLNEASEDEEDMLDLAFGLTKTSRLGCQIIISEELDGLAVRLPGGTNSGHALTYRRGALRGRRGPHPPPGNRRASPLAGAAPPVLRW
ncbi:2Fe-2S ferredoxin (FdII) (modular protein) [Azospirillum baldaniorum]|uniref:2Fe-2S ferredoxin n=1 Tax=Azospirillum baldaniorum TaxID=1064539 RepID=A0A9P1JQ26_9PROT|nr:2Fe-2S ferredoxin (FdII) (modular protein) [Azospirillum baldaniorum]